MIGIYIFKNIKEKKVYIGQSSRLERRKYEHYHSSLKDDFHLDLRENPDDFEYKVLQECLVKELDTLESMWMNWYKNEGWELYNVCLRKMPNNRGKHHSEEYKKKMSEAKKGKNIGENHPMFGKHHSEEYKKKMSEARKGREPWNKGIPWSEESKKKMSESHKGKSPSEETKKKISESLKGNVPWNKGREPWNKGKKIGHWRINPETGKREYY